MDVNYVCASNVNYDCAKTVPDSTNKKGPKSKFPRRACPWTPTVIHTISFFPFLGPKANRDPVGVRLFLICSTTT